MLGGALAAGQENDGIADFTWSMPARYGHHVVAGKPARYPQSAAEVDSGPFPVDFELDPAACRRGVARTFRISGAEPRAQRLGKRCAFRLSFESEGAYDVELKIEGGGEDASSTQTVVVQDFLIVSLGDSFASGEGNPDNEDILGPKWQDRRCHRSAFAGPSLAARLIEGSDATERDARTSVTFVHLACSGAKITEGLTGGYLGSEPHGRREKTVPLRPQLDELRDIARKREIDAVLVSGGGNDVGFADLITFCIKERNCPTKEIDTAKLDVLPSRRLVLDDAAPLALAQLPARYADVDAKLPADLPRDRVFIVEYIDATHRTTTELCDKILADQVDRPEIEWAYDNLFSKLNQAVAKAATDHGWRLVTGLAADSATHGYCTGNERWMRQLHEALLARNSKGTMHPNREGNAQIGDHIDELLRPALVPNGVPREPRSPEDQGELAAKVGVVPAELAEEDAVVDTGDGLGFGPGLLIGAAIGALLAAGVALLLRRR